MYTPPARFASATFASFHPETPSQQQALRAAEAFTRRLLHPPGFRDRLAAWLGRAPESPPRHGLYLVGPVGTGKTHLLAAMYHALHPTLPCAFLHSSRLFRLPDHPETLAARLADRYRVLCLDEVELDDPANEARLVLILKTLERLGVTLLATSNVEPEKFLSVSLGNDRFRRFLTEEFRARYEVIVVRGEDYRQRLGKPGRAWIGPPEEARARLREAFENDPGRACWLSFDELMEAATHTEHTRLLHRLADCDSLYLADIAIDGTDTALRLLRIIDDLYLHPHPPRLFFSAATPPEAWLRAGETHGLLERGIAEKFARTTSRLTALCEIERVPAADETPAS